MYCESKVSFLKIQLFCAAPTRVHALLYDFKVVHFWHVFVGEGQFGEVYLAHVMMNTREDPNDTQEQRVSSAGQQVAVKMLWSNASAQVKSDFQREMNSLARFDHAHITRVLGVITLCEPLCLLVEHLEYGDLHQFMLRKFPPADICNNFTTMGTMGSTLAGRAPTELK